MINPYRKLKVLEGEINSLNNAMASRGQYGAYDATAGTDWLHQLYCDFGYPQDLTFDKLYWMYTRNGVAKALVDLPIKYGWLEDPTVESVDLGDLPSRVSLWQMLKTWDNYQRVGRYAGLFMRVADGQPLDSPMTPRSGPQDLVSMLPLYEGQLKITEWEQDPTSPRFGKPTMYQYQQTMTGTKNSDERTLNFTAVIHWSRVLIAGEGTVPDSIYGVSALEASFNSLMDVRKVIGSGAEGYYRNAAPMTLFRVPDSVSTSNLSSIVRNFTEIINDFFRAPFRRSLITPFESETVHPALSDPNNFFMIAVQDAAAPQSIPTALVLGKQSGKLAATEDTRAFLGVVQSRKEDWQTHGIVTPFLDWCSEWGILEVPKEVEVTWSDSLAMGTQEQADVADKMADTNNKQFTAGQPVAYSVEEIRTAAGLDPEAAPESGTLDPGEVEE